MILIPANDLDHPVDLHRIDVPFPVEEKVAYKRGGFEEKIAKVEQGMKPAAQQAIEPADQQTTATTAKQQAMKKVTPGPNNIVGSWMSPQ